MQGAGSALMGIGSARGDDRAVQASELAISSPLLEASIDGAHGVLLSIQGGSDLGLFEIHEAARLVQEAAHPEANIIFGAVIDDALGDEVRVTVIAAGFDSGAPQSSARPEPAARATPPAQGAPAAAPAVPPAQPAEQVPQQQQPARPVPTSAPSPEPAVSTEPPRQPVPVAQSGRRTRAPRWRCRTSSTRSRAAGTTTWTSPTSSSEVLTADLGPNTWAAFTTRAGGVSEGRSEERRVGKEGRTRGGAGAENEKIDK